MIATVCESEVDVVCGASDVTLAVAGDTVGDVRAATRDMLNIPSAALAFIGRVGEPLAKAKETDILRAFYRLEFLRQRGRKGGGKRPAKKAALPRKRDGQATAQQPLSLEKPAESGLTQAASETELLQRYEAVIEAGLKKYIEVGHALMSIRDERVYKPKYNTFDAYCRERWKIKRNYANKIIDASVVAKDLGTNVPKLPEAESHARPLTALPKSERAEAWREAVETAPGGKITGKHVKKVVERHRLAKNPNKPEASVCPRGGIHEPDGDGDCQKCKEPGVTKVHMTASQPEADALAIIKLVDRIMEDDIDLRKRLDALADSTVAGADWTHDVHMARNKLQVVQGLKQVRDAAQKVVDWATKQKDQGG
jgi:hypothetical protein